MKLPDRLERLQTLSPVPFALLLSLLFSVLVIAGNPIPNDDAFAYLRAAELFNTQGTSAVLDSYGWFGYSILIALADRILPLDLLGSAWLLNGAGYLLLTWAFVSICRELNPDPLIGWLAALVILAFPLINELRYYVIRDVGYWAFSLSAVLQLLRYNRLGAVRNAGCWCLFTVLAVFFRLEALLPMLLAPFALLVSGPDRRVQAALLLKLLASLLISVAVVTVLCLSLRINLPELMQFAYRYYLPLIYDFGSLLNAAALELNAALFTAENFPGHDNSIHGLIILLFAYCYTVLANLIAALSVPLSLLLLYGWYRGWLRLPQSARAILLTYIGCGLFSLLLFQFIMHFQVQRYAALLSLLLLLPLPQLLAQLWRRARDKGHSRGFAIGFMLACVYFFTDSLVSFGYSKHYLEQAADWAGNELPEQATLATNIPSVAYASKVIGNYDSTDNDPMQVIESDLNRDYVILFVSADNAELRELLERQRRYRLLESFSNSRGDEARIYRHRRK